MVLLFLLYLGIGVVSPLLVWRWKSVSATYALSDEPAVITSRAGDDLTFARGFLDGDTTCTVRPLDGESREIELRPHGEYSDVGAHVRAWWTGEAAVSCAGKSNVEVSAPGARATAAWGVLGTVLATLPGGLILLVLGYAGLQTVITRREPWHVSSVRTMRRS